MKSKKITSTLIVIVAFVVFYLLVGCPIRFFTGICCAGCGMTRAAFSLLKLDFAGAFYFNPLIYTMPFFAILGLIFRKDRKKLKIIVGVLCVALLVLYIYRMVTGCAPDVVYFDPEKGMIYKIIRSVING